MYKREGLPEKGDLVICTIKRVLPHSAFVKLDEFDNKEGMIHDSELSRKWTRNRKSYLRKGRKLVCKVMNTKDNKIFLSVKRVGPAQARAKKEEWNEEKKAHKILNILADQLDMSTEKIYEKVGNKILEKEGLIYPFLLEVAKDGKGKLEKLGVDSKLSEKLFKLIEKRITVPKAEIKAEINLKIKESDGIEKVKKFFKEIQKSAEEKESEVEITYCGAPKYKVEIISPDYKKGEKIINEIKEKGEQLLKSNDGSFNLEKK